MNFLEQTQLVITIFGLLLTVIGLFLSYLMIVIALKALNTWKEQNKHSIFEKMYTNAPKYYNVIKNLRSTWYTNISDEEIKNIELNYPKSKFIGYRKDLKNSYNYLKTLQADREFLTEILIKLNLLPNSNEHIKSYYIKIKNIIDNHEILLRNLDFVTDVFDQTNKDIKYEIKSLEKLKDDLEKLDQKTFEKKYDWIESKEQANEYINERMNWIESRRKLLLKTNQDAVSLHKELFILEEDESLKKLYDQSMESIKSITKTLY